MKEITRRSLLKTGLTTGALLAASPLLDFRKWAAAASEAPVTIVPSLCQGCSSHCGLLVHVKNGRVWKVSGHPDHNRSKGRLCARAHAAATMPYNADRLTQPMKREGDTFKPITYDQALDEIAAKLKAVLEKNGPGTVFYEYNPRETGVFYGTRFMNAIGAPTVMTHQATCNNSTNTGLGAIFGAVPGSDLAGSKYIIFIGRNPAEGIRTAYTNSLAVALEKGAKVVSVDPRQSQTAALATEWVPIRPGTDLALLLAMANVLISENLYDAAFVAENTKDFDKFAAAVAKNTPAWAASITDIPAETITRLAREIAAAKPNCVIDPGWKAAFGTNYNNGSETARALGAVNALLGNLGQPGGLTFPPGPTIGALDPTRFPEPKKPTIPRLDGAGVAGEFPLAPAAGIPQYLMQKAKEGKVKAGLIRHHNPVRNFPDPKHISAGLKVLDLLVVVDTHLSETALLAHYVLPETTWLERDEVVEGSPGGKPTAGMRVKAIDRVHKETRNFDEIIVELAKRMGLGQYFNFTMDELNAARLAPMNISLADMKKKGSVTFDLPAAAPGMGKLKTASGKVEFANPKWAAAGFSEVAQWIAPKVMPDPKNPKSFRIIHGKQGYHTHTMSIDIPYLNQISREYNAERLWMNASRAKALGIVDGDLVVVKSPLASAKVHVKVTERLHPDAVYLPMGYGLFSPHQKLATGYGISMNDFVPYQMEPISGHSMMMEATVEVEKA